MFISEETISDILCHKEIYIGAWIVIYRKMSMKQLLNGAIVVESLPLLTYEYLPLTIIYSKKFICANFEKVHFAKNYLLEQFLWCRNKYYAVRNVYHVYIVIIFYTLYEGNSYVISKLFLNKMIGKCPHHRNSFWEQNIYICDIFHTLSFNIIFHSAAISFCERT